MADAPDAYIGRTLDKRYRVDRLIGRGGMGAVYEAHHIGLDRKVAVKFVLGGDADAKARFQREARAASKIDHDNVVHIYDVGVDEGVDFIAMEFVEGTDLSKALRAGPFEVSRAVHIARQLVAGLGAVHAAGIVHRDIKPANIMLTEYEDDRDFVKIMDFGISKSFDHAGAQITLAGRVIGTPQYMAPEQLVGDEAGPRSDLYAAALVIYEMLAGAAPFHGGNTDAVVEKSLRDAPKRLDEIRDDVPVALARAIDRALDKVPGQRFATADAMLDALGEGRTSSRTVAARPAPTTVTGPQTRPTRVEGRGRVDASTTAVDRPASATKPRARWPLALAALLVLGVPLGVFLAMRGTNEHAAPPPTPPPPPIAVVTIDASVINEHLAAAQQADRDGKPVEAIAAYRRYLETNPNAPDATQIVARIASLAPEPVPTPKPVIAQRTTPPRPGAGRAPTNRAEACLCQVRDAEGYTSLGCRKLAAKPTCACGGVGAGHLCAVPKRVDEYNIHYCDAPNDVVLGKQTGDACRGFDSSNTMETSQVWCVHCENGTYTYAGATGESCAGYQMHHGTWAKGKLVRCGTLSENDWR